MAGDGLLSVTHLSYEGAGEWALRFTGPSDLFWDMIETLRADQASWEPALFAGRGGWLLSEEQLLSLVDRFANLTALLNQFDVSPDESSGAIDLPSALQAACSILHVPLRSSVRQVRQQYKSLSKLYHPDSGGDHRYFVALQAAYEQVMGYLRHAD
jgi:hypothetical protein